MLMDRLTQQANEVLELAREEARRLDAEFVGTEHLLLGLLREAAGGAGRMLRDRKLDLRLARREVEMMTPPGMPLDGRHRELGLGARAKRVLEFAAREARRHGHDRISTEHLLMGLLRETDGVAIQILSKRASIEVGELETHIQAALSAGKLDPPAQGRS